MRSMVDDLNTRARIRDAAIALFGRQGFAAATIRAVAAEARVSPGLVIHHFGSKAGLREACDTHVLAETAGQGIQKTDPQAVGTQIRNFLSHPEQYAHEIAYVRQSLSDESDAGDAFFDGVVAQTRAIIEAGIAGGTIRAFDDVATTAVVVATNSLSMLVLGRHAARAVGTSELGPDMLRALTLPTVDLYTNGFYTDTRFLDAARAALQARAPEPTGTETAS
ncbi:TetR family transcriptional regulator [Arthrobacter sp. 2MCAF14]